MRRMAMIAMCAVGAAALVGCGRAASTASWADRPKAVLLFDAMGGATERFHFSQVPDPYGGSDTVGKGTWGAQGGQKMTTLNKAGFFAMPADARNYSVIVRLALRGKRDLRFVLVDDAGKGVSYRRTAPEEDRWCEIELPLSQAVGRIKPGRKVVDITVMASDPSEDARLYIHSAVLAKNKGAG